MKSIYALKSCGNVVYVGYTKTPEIRLYNHQLRWPDIEEMIILEEVDQNACWRDREHFWISKFRDEGVALRNKTVGRNGQECLSDETRKKLSIIRTGKPRPPTSEATREKMRQAKLGRVLPDEHRMNIGKAHKGNKRPQHVIDALIKANTGKTHSEETIKKLSAINKGKVLSEETKRKISEGNKVRPCPPKTPEGLARIAAAARHKRGPMNEEHREKIRAARLAGEAKRREQRHEQLSAGVQS